MAPSAGCRLATGAPSRVGAPALASRLAAWWLLHLAIRCLVSNVKDAVPQRTGWGRDELRLLQTAGSSRPARPVEVAAAMGVPAEGVPAAAVPRAQRVWVGLTTDQSRVLRAE